MSKKIENTFKEKLENFEMPYESSAWDQFSKKLDGAPSSPSSFKPLHYAALIVGAAVIGSVVYFAVKNNNETATKSKYKQELIAEQQDTPSDEVSDLETETKTNNESTPNLSNEVKTETDRSTLEDKSSTPTLTNEPAVEKEKQQPSENKTSQPDDSSPSPASARGSSDRHVDDTPPVKRRFVAGTVVNSEICEGEFVKIENNDEDGGFVRVKFGNTDLTIPAGQFSEIKMTNTEYVYFLNEVGEVINRKQIVVHEKPQVDFSHEANLYENGLPITFFDAYGSFKEYHWSFGNQQKAKGANVHTNFFSKGSFEVELKVIDHNNCSTVKTKKIQVEDDYNLMASNAFRPNDHDARNRTFMPYALTQRDVNFELVIVDPKTHAVIFKSKDASEGWDGRDQRTGQMRNANSAYVWKVHLENPEPGEKAIYMGTVTLKK